MSIHVHLSHRTRYRFDTVVSVSPHEIRLRPSVHCRIPISGYSLAISPQNHFIHWQQDVVGNHVAKVTFLEPLKEISINVELIADMTVINPFDFLVEDWADHFPFAYPSQNHSELAPYLECEVGGDAFNDYLFHVRSAIPKEIRTTDLLVLINRMVQKEIRYMVRLEPGVQSPDETVSLGSGSCRDSAWLLAQLLRHLGIATRFVSGYLVQLVADDVGSIDDPEGPSEDFSDLHAWCEAYIPGAGWVGMDATSGLLAGECHIPLAVSGHPYGASPVIGRTGKCKAELEFSMSVSRIHVDLLPFLKDGVSREKTDELRINQP